MGMEHPEVPSLFARAGDKAVLGFPANIPRYLPEGGEECSEPKKPSETFVLLDTEEHFVFFFFFLRFIF